MPINEWRRTDGAPEVCAWASVSRTNHKGHLTTSYHREHRAVRDFSETVSFKQVNACPLTMTFSKESILRMSREDGDNFSSGFLFDCRMSLSFFKNFLSVTHSASTPSRPLTCHHFSPPTTCCSSSGSNHSMSISAALLHVIRGIMTGETAAHGGETICVFVLCNKKSGPFSRTAI